LVIKRSSAAETERLIADALAGDPVRREAAVARLAILGARAVDRLVAALGPAAGDDQRIAILTALERIGDARALPAASTHLASGSIDVALAAIAAIRPHLTTRDVAVSSAALDLLAGALLDATHAERVRTAALNALGDLPQAVVAPLLARAREDPTWGPHEAAGDAGSETDAVRHGRSWAVDRIDGGGLPEGPEEVRKAVAAEGATAPLPLLHRVIVAIRAKEKETGDELRAHWLAARAAVHQALALRGSRVALYDLRETLEHGTPLPLAMMTALGTIGDASCLEPLASAIASTNEPWLKAHLTEAFTEIRQRERLTRRHALIRRLAERYPELV
jgi:HEAT repeat protein